MKKLIPILAMLLGMCSFVNAQQSDSWLNHFKKEIAAVGSEPAIEQLAMLTRLVANEPDSERKSAARELAWQKLQSIPDFPERIRDHILKKKEQLRRREILMAEYYSARDFFGPLGGVPDSRIVGVLGEFLYDGEWPLGESLQARLDNSYPNSTLAMQALGRLIEHPPVQGEPRSYKDHDIETWKLWYEQVKAGTRTFRFKGDPQEYSLTGPVSAARESRGVDRAVASKEVLVSPAETEKKESGVAVWALAIAGGLLAAAVWAVVRRRAVAS